MFPSVNYSQDTKLSSKVSFKFVGQSVFVTSAVVWIKTKSKKEQLKREIKWDIQGRPGNGNSVNYSWIEK